MQSRTEDHKKELRKLSSYLSFVKDHRARVLREAEELNARFNRGMITIGEYDAFMDTILKGKSIEQAVGGYDKLITKYSQKVMQLEDELDRENILAAPNPPESNLIQAIFLVMLVIMAVIVMAFATNPTAFSVFDSGNIDSPQNKTDSFEVRGQDSQSEDDLMASQSGSVDVLIQEKENSGEELVELMNKVVELARESDVSLNKEEILPIIDKLDKIVS